jgi:hypothetical protein
MDPEAFLKSIYLGDRACKAVIIDCWANEMKVQIDCISRIRSETWNYYNDENLDDGFIVFEGVQRLVWDPGGKLPSDTIIDFRVKPSGIPECKYLFELTVASGGADGLTPVTLGVFCDALALESHSGSEGRIRT